MQPLVAVACGSSIYYFKNFAAYMKFELPMVQFSQEEKDIWKLMGQCTSEQNMPPFCEQLFALREKGVFLSIQSVELLAMENIQD